MTLFSTRGSRPARLALPSLNAAARPTVLALMALLLTTLFLTPAAQAHHLMELLHLQPTPFSGLISGLAHPLLGPDHLLFLLALALVGLQRRVSWMLGLLAMGLVGSGLGLILPGLPGSEALVSMSLVAVGLVLFDRLPTAVLLPAFALHGYALSAAVLGWTGAPISFYLLGLLISQGALLLLSLTVLRQLAGPMALPTRQVLAGCLIGIGSAWTWSALVG